MSATILASASFPAAPARRTSKTQWTSRVLTGLVLLFFTFDTSVKLFFASPEIMEGVVKMGFAPQHLLVIGLLELACLVLYAIPRTAPLGALLFTGYLGGAIVTHLRVSDPLFSHTLFPTYVAALVWGSLYLRDPRIRALVGRR